METSSKKIVEKIIPAYLCRRYRGWLGQNEPCSNTKARLTFLSTRLSFSSTHPSFSNSQPSIWFSPKASMSNFEGWEGLHLFESLKTYKKQKKICSKLYKKEKELFGNLNTSVVSDNMTFWKVIKHFFTNKCSFGRNIKLNWKRRNSERWYSNCRRIKIFKFFTVKSLNIAENTYVINRVYDNSINPLLEL